MNTMTIPNLWLIPFPGFYNTVFEPHCDGWELADYFELTNEQCNDNDFVNNLLWSFDNETYEHDVAERCAEVINNLVCIQLGVETGELFSISNPTMWSPREYNFANDHLEVCFETNDIERLHKVLLAWCAAHKDYLEKCIKRDNTAYDGYIPYYSNRYDEWMQEWQQFDSDPVAFAELLGYIACYDIPEDEVSCRLYYEVMDDIFEPHYYKVPETV